MEDLKEIIVTCPDCEDGYVEVRENCSLPASMCCGGCTKIEVCETCEGSAEIDIIDNVGIEVNEIRKMVQDLRISLNNLDIDNVEDTIKQLIFKN